MTPHDEMRRHAIWLSKEQASELLSCAISKVEEGTGDEREQRNLKHLLSELGVAKPRFANGDIPAESLRLALGKLDGETPIRLSREEALTALDTLNLSKETRNKIFLKV